MNRLALILALSLAACGEAEPDAHSRFDAAPDTLDEVRAGLEPPRDRDVARDDSMHRNSNPVGTLKGSLPSFTDFDQPIDYGVIWTSSGSEDLVSLELHTQGAGWAMIYGDFDPSELADSIPTQMNPHDFIVCSGPVPNDYSFDDSPTDVVITAELGAEGTTAYTLRAMIDGVGLLEAQFATE